MIIELTQTGFYPPSLDNKMWGRRRDEFHLDALLAEQIVHLPPGGLSLNAASYCALHISFAQMMFRLIFDGYDAIPWQPFPLDNRWHIYTITDRYYAPSFRGRKTSDIDQVFVRGRIRYRIRQPVYLSVFEELSKIVDEADMSGVCNVEKLRDLRREMILSQLAR